MAPTCPFWWFQWLTVGVKDYIVATSGAKGRGPDATEDGAE